ncbi:retrovirus-related Pol polyprotein from transposon 17.6 [Nephila pilipes]|uniref:Retrovirus-related Pol polyprotein from transposon 17.6 n=1 Tax=Nephila pilipes TaxID=299642 RepID=A0A8X6P5B0_NEPPI|nr:retrovirus-related Pol polyprotein from transposon 17.6 [Nephila pilipes]
MLQVITEESVVKEAAALLEAENLRKAQVLAAEKENVEKQQKYELKKLQLQLENSIFKDVIRLKKEESSEVICYGCGTPGVIKPKCPSCKGKDKRNYGIFSSVCLQSASCPSKQLATLQVTINGVMGTACADTAATHSIAGETLYHILKKQGTTFSTGSLTVSLADGSKIEREVNTTCVKIRLGGRTLPLNHCHYWGEKQQHPFGSLIPPAKALRRRGRPARIIKSSSPTPANAQIHRIPHLLTPGRDVFGVRGGGCNRWFKELKHKPNRWRYPP